MRTIHFQIGGGHIPADLGLPDAEEYMAKTKFALRIIEIVRERRLTQTQAAELLGLKQAHFPSVDNLGRRPSIPAWSWD
jgi:predicted XRE-type DNA-binding protein